MDGETQQPATQPQTASQTTQPTGGNIKFITIIKIIIIIFLLAAAAYAAYYFYNQMQMKNRDTQRKTDLQTISQALEKYKQKTQNSMYYPAAITQNTLVKNGFLDNVPMDPKSNSPYSYASTPQNCDINCTGYILAACLENKNDPEGKEPLNNCQAKSFVIDKSS